MAKSFLAKSCFAVSDFDDFAINNFACCFPAFIRNRRIVIEQLERGMTWTEVARARDGRVANEAIAEAIAIADLVVKHEPFKGFHVGARRNSTRRPAALAA